MLFSEPLFLLFFLPLLLIIYFIVPRGLRNTLLLIASLSFYAIGEKVFVVIMLFSIFINYITGISIDAIHNKNHKRIALIVGVSINLALLLVFKYANFTLGNINNIIEVFNIQPITYTKIHLPIGISFFTFQAMSYIIDVYRGKTKSQKNPGKVALYISFFPQLIAGPIVRYTDIAKHLEHRKETLSKFSYGVKRFVIGLSKKMIIANVLAYPADIIFNLPQEELQFSLTWLAIICYSLQIYFDFSGYSDMAIGLGRMFGFKFPENFNYPYISRSITEFWRRWHLSLSTWFRDYLYIPLGGSRKSESRTYFNLLIVFLLCGLWHGASWNFLVWGLIHGLMLIIERIGFGEWLKKQNKILQHFYVLFIVIISWVFFRAPTLTEALHFLSIMFGASSQFPEARFFMHYLNIEIAITIIIGVFASTPLISELFKRTKYQTQFYNYLNVLRLAGLSFILCYSLLLMASGAYNPFIYFRF